VWLYTARWGLQESVSIALSLPQVGVEPGVESSVLLLKV
jgi:hypothetical protein